MKKYICAMIVMILMVFLVGCSSAPSDDNVLVLGSDESGNPVLADTSLSAVQQKGKLVVGSDIPYPPMEFFDENGEAVGLDIDVIKAIAEKLGVEVEVVDYDWDNMFVAVADEEVDVAIASITITVERAQSMLFSIPYFDAGQVAVIRAADEEILSVEDLAGKKIGAQMETTSYDEAVRLAGDEALVASYETADTVEGEGMIPDLENSLIDAIIADYVSAADVVKNNPSLKILGEPFTQEYYGIITNLGNDALMDAINSALRELVSSGELKSIQDSWLK